MSRLTGLLATGDLVCDGCGVTMKHLERYAFICEDGQVPERLCESCSWERELLKKKKDDKGRDIETFL
ncbi:MAG: hypothetical protein SVY53_10745 [Chloroflexota bacterium]|nr:hypothetical protein [Chloroflexota bacterium]